MGNLLSPPSPFQPETDPTQPAPGDGAEAPGLLLQLPEESVSKLALEIERTLGDYETMMESRRRKEQEIENAYALIPDPERAGAYPNASELPSELILSQVDQATARIEQAILDIEPMVAVEPIVSKDSADPSSQRALQEAASTEEFLENYLKEDVKFPSKLSLAAHNTSKLGTAVFYSPWAKSHEKRYYRDEYGQRQETIRERGRLDLKVLDNKDVLAWPPWETDWQQLEWVGHRWVMTKSQFTAWAFTLKLPPETVEKVLKYSDGDSQAYEVANTFGGTDRQNIDVDQMQSDQPLVLLWGLWGNRLIEGLESPLPCKFQLFYHPGLKKVLWMDYNRNDNQKHPYFPLRYKQLPNAAWGDGIGHEILYCHYVDQMLRCLRVDNLQSSAFGIAVVRTGSMLDVLDERLYPGKKVPSEDPEGDFRVVSMSPTGALDTIDEAAQENEGRARRASGIAAVLGGQGDPTMKSGAGTGSTIALIEEAGKKLGYVDSSMRRDLSEFFKYVLETVCQYADDAIYYSYASTENAEGMRAMKYAARFEPPRGDLERKFKIYAKAPSAASNKELRKQNLMIIFQMLNGHLMQMQPMAQMLYQMENPAGLTGYLHRVIDFMDQMVEEVVDLHDIVTLKGRVPSVDPPTPPEMMINYLQSQVMELTQQLQALGAGAGGTDPNADPSLSAQGAAAPPAPAPF